jgi:adenosylcobinamide-GDP ribazoletransferase
MIKGLKGILGFLTIIPVGRDVDLYETARSSWMFPIVGALIAFIAALIEDISSYYFSAFISSAIALFSLLVLTGFHHLDGLLDFGDALMYRGNVSERQKVLHDASIGVGGFVFGFFTLLFSYLAIVESYDVYIALIAAETSAKFSMVLGAYLGKPSHEGMGSIFVGISLWKVLTSFIIYIVLISLVIREAGLLILAVAVTIIFSTLMVRISNRTLGGISGDVFGAMNELTRMIILLVLTWRWTPL